ncbi:stimulated by retinoic acid gene 6 protein-like [Glandiceps talaboti]
MRHQEADIRHTYIPYGCNVFGELTKQRFVLTCFSEIMESSRSFGVEGVVASDSNSSDASKCRTEDVIRMDIFVHICLIPSVTIILILSCLVKRRKHFVRVLGGRPGMLSPVNFMESYSNRWSFAVAFGATTSMLVALFWGTYSAYFVSTVDHLWAKVFISLLSVAEIGLNYYPLFICLATPFKLIGSTLGFLYAGLWFSVQLYNIIVCPRPPTAVFDYQALVIQLPVLLCLVFLLFRYCQRFCQTLRNWYYELKDDDDEEEEDDTKILKDHQVKHVRALLQKTPTDTSSNEVSKWKKVLYKIYTPEPGFRYSPRFICTMVVLLLCLYQIVIVFIYIVAFLFHGLVELVDVLITDIGPLLNVTEQADFNSTMITLKRVVSISEDCWYVATACTSLIEVFFLVHVTVCFRKHMKRMWRGEKNFLPVRKTTSAFIIGEGLKYSGYQIAYFLWSYLVIQIVVWVVLVLFTYLFVVPFIDQSYQVLIYLAQVLIPYLSVAAFVLYGQYLLAKYCFVQDRICDLDEDKPLALKNRKLYHNFSYFLFFYNVAIGIIVCLLRIFIGMILGTIFLGRIDRPVLMRGYEKLDKGFSAYVGMLCVENGHCHPVLVCFCQLLINDMEKQRKYESMGLSGMEGGGTINKRGTGGSRWSQASRGTYKYRRSYTMDGDPALSKSYKRAVHHWQVAYTLLNNPSLIEDRKRQRATEYSFEVYGTFRDPHSKAVRLRSQSWHKRKLAKENGGISQSVFYDDESAIDAEERNMIQSTFYDDENDIIAEERKLNQTLNQSRFYVSYGKENGEKIPLGQTVTTKSDGNQSHHDDTSIDEVFVSIHDSPNVETNSQIDGEDSRNSLEDTDVTIETQRHSDQDEHALSQDGEDRVSCHSNSPVEKTIDDDNNRDSSDSVPVNSNNESVERETSQATQHLEDKHSSEDDKVDVEDDKVDIDEERKTQLSESQSDDTTQKRQSVV